MKTRVTFSTWMLLSAALLVGLTATSAARAETADAEMMPIEQVVVTGSRIKRSDLTSISPISVLSEEDLEASGNLTLEDFLQDLPSTLGGADYGSTVNNGNPGLATVQLRGLGPTRTLVLVNGYRPGATPEGFTDLNMIPTAIIERIEVLRDGASTVYGSDAIAGVVNIITKRDFEGMELDVGYDVTDETDGEQYSAALTWGTAFDRGNIVLSAQYTKRADIWQRDRGFSACPFIDAPGGGTACAGSPTTTPANITAEIDNSSNWVVDQGTGEVRPYVSTLDAYNFAAASYMVTPQEVYSLYGAANYTILEDLDFSTVEAFMEAGFSNRESDQLLAAVGTFWSPMVPADNPFNPFGEVLCGGNPNCSEPQDTFIARRIEESGGRSFLQDAEGWRFLVGLRGEFQNGWLWDVSYNYADWTDAQRDGGRAIQPRIEAMLDPDLCAADSLCDPNAGGVGLWDAFNRGTMTPEQISYGLVAVNTLERARLRSTQLNLSGDVMGLFELPGGQPSWALGYEHRSEKAESLPDGGAAIGAIYFTPGNVTKGSYSVDEVYGELALPLLAEVPFAEALNVEGSFRWTDYNFVKGSDTTYKVAVEWAPVMDIRFRYTWAEGFRAPNITERFLGIQKTAASYTDPCNNWDTSGNATIIANCGPGGDNLPVGFTVDAPQATTLEGGTPNLEPETSESQTFGVVFTPSFLEGLSITVDYYDIEIDDAVGTAGTGNVINNCYRSQGFSDPLCALLAGPSLVGESPSGFAPARRNAVNQVAGVLLTNQNLSTFETSGVDFQIDYGFDTGIGRIDLRAAGTYIDEYKYLPFEGGVEQSLAGKFGIDPYNKNAIATFPEWAVNYSVRLTRDNWGATVTARWTDETLDGFDGKDCGNECVADDVWYIDLHTYYDWDNMTFTFGMRNLTDEEPPYVTNYDDMNTLHYSYDTAGRYFYGRWSVRL